MTADLINSVFPSLIRFGSRPGGIVLVAAAIADGFFLLFSYLAARTTGAPFAWFLFVVAAGLAVFVALLAWRRARLTRHVDEMEAALAAQQLSAGVVDRPAPAADRLGEEMAFLEEVRWENSVRTARYFPRIEAAQRALVLAAGGTVNAPYLKDDLRVTLVALLGTLAAIPIGALGAMVSLTILVFG
jgi:hypothetical protein